MLKVIQICKARRTRPAFVETSKPFILPHCASPYNSTLNPKRSTLEECQAPGRLGGVGTELPASFAAERSCDAGWACRAGWDLGCGFVFEIWGFWAVRI